MEKENRKKVGILTFHNAHNYGAVLQAYALRTTLRKMGHEAFIINYRNKSIERSYLRRLKPTINIFDGVRTYFKLWHECIYRQKIWSRQCDRFNEFIEQVLLEGDVALVEADCLKDLDVDAYICGSDQIWTFELTGGVDSVYFLDFKTNALKISYAASKFTPQIKEDEKEYFAKTLSDFAAISVREKPLADELIKEIHMDAYTVLDPVLLLGIEEYRNLKKPIHEHYKFILVYYLVEDRKLYDCSVKLSNLLQLPIIEIHFYRIHGKERNQRADCGPGEFLSYFDAAEYVLTNSFHGVAFSILFQKNFWAVYDKDSRKDNLLKLFCFQERHVYDENQINENKLVVPYETAKQKLKQERMKSVEFLRNALKIEKALQ